MDIEIAYDAPSIYEGHQSNIDKFAEIRQLRRSDVFVFLHDDIEILSSHDDFYQYVTKCREPGVGFVGVAGAYNLREDGVWWNSRNFGEARGIVFQGENCVSMTPNYFGKSGEVVVLDGCFMACAGDTLEMVKMKKPDYLTSDWDFYDIGLTFNAHMMGLRNYTVPILTRHVSNGEMREGWFNSQREFVRFANAYLPRKPILSMEETDGLPC